MDMIVYSYGYYFQKHLYYVCFSSITGEKEMEQFAVWLEVTPGKEKDFPPAVTESTSNFFYW
jgi:hypothetical protein